MISCFSTAAKQNNIDDLNFYRNNIINEIKNKLKQNKLNKYIEYFIQICFNINWSLKSNKELLKVRFTCFPLDLLKKIIKSINEKEKENLDNKKLDNVLNNILEKSHNSTITFITTNPIFINNAYIQIQQNLNPQPTNLINTNELQKNQPFNLIKSRMNQSNDILNNDKIIINNKDINELTFDEMELLEIDFGEWIWEFKICTKLGFNPIYWGDKLLDIYKKALLSEQLHEYLMPTLPRNILELYSNMISDVIDCYISKFVKVQRIGPYDKDSKIDFKIEENKSEFACILNTGGGNGSHWTSLYIKINQNEKENGNTIEYFDSLGMEPNPLLKKIIDNILLNIRKKFPTLSKKCCFGNELVQISGLDCGVYCTHFIIYKMNNGSIYDFIETDLSPQKISSYKTIYWNYL
jgi:hypothetical protein